MMWSTEIPFDAEPIGYRALIEMFKIKTIPHDRWSYISPKWEKRQIDCKDQKLTLYLYPPSYRLPANPFKHLEFALKHEGFHLLILKEVLKKLSAQEMENYIQQAPTGKYTRILWFLYEELLGKMLALEDLKKGSYVSLLDPAFYYTGISIKSPRHRVSNNLLGNLHFSPMVRRTPLLQQYESKKLELVAHHIPKKYDLSLLSRALHYLYHKETMASWEIEREKPDQAHLVRFATLLQRAGTLGHLSEDILVQLQKEIVDPRFALEGYRNFQNYIGEEPALQQLMIHYIAPKPEDVPELMKNLLETFERLITSHIHPVIIATILSFGFVFIHPFWDGNGRLHRFLIHYVLGRCGFSPKEFIFPISATIIRQIHHYDQMLESFSRPLLALITDYTINDAGEMTIQQETIDLYRYADFTSLAEYLFECVEQTITVDFQQELQFLIEYDNIKHKIKELLDIPDQQIDLFIRCVRQNHGHLSARKREKYFHMLTDEEIREMEMIVDS